MNEPVLIRSILTAQGGRNDGLMVEGQILNPRTGLVHFNLPDGTMRDQGRCYFTRLDTWEQR